ncbi:exodeoxyribonuclease III, partial [Luminiphilus sp.]|nr:exodeoxyribonuclease III [Luminiphilus sp.]
CGGWELAWQPRDAEEAGNRLDLPGFSHEERDWLASLYRAGYSDAFREIDANGDDYTWWPEGDERPGLRTDTHIISESLAPCVLAARIESEEAFSSHAPVIIDYDIEL